MRGARIENIREIIFPLIEGKKLLDIGCIGHNFEERRSMGTFYIEEFQKKAASAKGIDILVDDVKRAQAWGFNVEVGDAESFVDGEKYDAIFAGDLIEHLSNPGAFLKCAYENLRHDGVVILSTPNTFSFSRILRCVTHGTNEPPLNTEHTCYFTPRTMEQLVSRWGFLINRLYYSDYDYGSLEMSKKKAAFLRINRTLSRLVPRFSQSFVVELKKKH